MLLISSIACAQTKVVYRVSSGEVLRITDGDTYNEGNKVGFAMAIDPVITDGTQWVDTNYNYRVLGYAKIYDNGTVRNATQEEIDSFAAYAID